MRDPASQPGLSPTLFSRGFSRLARWQSAGLVFFVVALAIWWWLPVFDAPASAFDEGMLVVAPELVLLGKVPHRDFGTYYGPANLWALAAVYKTIGVSLFSERLTGLFYRCGYLLALGWLGKRLAPGLSGMFILVGVVVVTPLNLLAQAWIAAVTLGLLSVLCATRAEGVSPRPSSSLFLGGVLAGVSLLYRPDFGLALTLAWLPILWSADWRARRAAFLGAFVGLLPLMLHAWLATPGALWRNFFLEPVLMSNPGRKFSLHWLGEVYFHFLMILLVVAAANLAVALWFQWKQRTAPQSTLHLAASLLALGMAPQILQRCDLPHATMGILVSMPLLLATLHRLASLFLTRLLWRNMVASFLVALFLAFLAKGYFLHKLTSGLRNASRSTSPALAYVSNGERTFPVRNDPRPYRDVIQFLQQSSADGEKVFIGQGDLRRAYINDIFLYHLLLPRLVPGSYFVEVNPLVANAPHSRLAADLEQCDWVILDSALDKIQEPNRGQEIGNDAPVRVLAERFQAVFQSGPLTVYHQKDRPR